MHGETWLAEQENCPGMTRHEYGTAQAERRKLICQVEDVDAAVATEVVMVDEGDCYVGAARQRQDSS